MKKTLLFMGIALLGCILKLAAQDPATTGVANNLLWYRLITSGNEYPHIQTPQQIIAASDGNLFASNIFYSTERDKASSIFNYDAPNKEDQYASFGDAGGGLGSGKTNITFYKIDPMGKLLWYIFSSRGAVTSNVMSMKPTPDGGFVTVLLAKDANSGAKTDRDILRIIQSDGSAYDVKLHSIFDCVGSKQGKRSFTEIPVLLKVGKDGMIQFHKVFGVGTDPMPDASTKFDWGTVNGVYIGDTAVDEDGNIYVGGNFRTTLTIDEIPFMPKNIVGYNGDPRDFAGDLFLAKFDPTGKLVVVHTEGGDPIFASKIKRLYWKEEELLLSCDFVGDDKEEKKVTAFGTEIKIPKETYYISLVCLNKELQAKWVTHFDAYSVPEHRWRFIYVDAITSGNGKVYMAGRCAGSIVTSDGTELFKQTVKAHRGYILAVDAATGKAIPGAYSLLPENGISNVLSVNVAGKRVVAGGYTLYNKSFYRVMDSNLSSETMKDYVYAEKGATIFDGNIIRNMFVGNVRSKGDLQLLTPEGYKNFDFDKFYSLIVAHKLPFPFLSADQSKLDLSKNQNKLDVYSSELTSPISVELTGEGFTSDQSELSTEGGMLTISFASAPTDTPEKREGKLTLRSGDEVYEVLLSAMTEGKKEITPSVQRIDFGDLPAGETKSEEVVLTFKNIAETVLCKVEGRDAKYFGLDKDSIAEVTAEGKLVVTFSPTKELKSAAEASLLLQAGDYEVRIPLSGKAIYTLGVSATELNFAKVKEGETKTMNLEVSPKGLASDEMITVEVTEGKNNFTVDKSSISGKEATTLAITFKPTSDIKATEGKLVLKSNDLEVVILLRGSNATGSELVEASGLVVIAREGELLLKSTTQGEVCIYDLSGSMLYREILDGEGRFALERGSYIVSFEGHTHKVVIR